MSRRILVIARPEDMKASVNYGRNGLCLRIGRQRNVTPSRLQLVTVSLHAGFHHISLYER